MEIRIDVDTVGPIFDGRAEMAIEGFRQHVEDELGRTGVSMIRNYLETQYKYLGHHGGTPEFNPVPPDAGRLQVAINYERQMDDVGLITDDDIIYGPWIEGIAPGNLIIWPHRRNPPPRRFTGYHAFRKITRSLNAIAVPIAYRELPLYIRMMND